MQLQSFQFCPVDYLSDSNVEAMTLEQQGAYIRLICHAWSSTTVGQLPNDDETLAQLSRLGEEKWAQSKSKILKAFDLSVDGFIVHRQLIAEYEKQKSFSEMQTEISNKRRKSANMRWECKTDANAMQMQCKTDAKPMQMQCKTDLERKEEEKEEKAPLVPPSLSHTLSLPPIIPPKEEKEEEKRDSCAFQLDEKEKKHWEKSFALFWKAYPRKVNKGKAEKAWYKLKPNEQLFSKILQGIERAKSSDDWLKDYGQFIPHPSTWLNAKGWEDSGIDQEALRPRPKPTFRVNDPPTQVDFEESRNALRKVLEARKGNLGTNL